MNFRIFRTKEFIKQFEKLSKQTQEEIKKIRDKLKENPFVGDQLGYKFFREKKLKGLRVYFLIYDDIKVILFLAVSDKKSQQATIDEIKLKLTEYYLDTHKKLKQGL